MIGVHGTARLLREKSGPADELRDSEARFRLMVEGSEQVFFYMHDAEGRFEYLSPSVEQVLGYSSDELIGQSYEVLLADNSTHVHTQTGRSLEQETGVNVYTAMTRHRDGRKVPIELVESSMKRGNTIVGVHGFARDITERWRAEQSLRDSEERFRAVVDSIGEGLIITDLDDIITYANVRVGDIIGIPASEIIGEVAHRVVLPEAEWSSFPVRMEQRAAGKSERYAVQYERPDAGTVWVEIHAFPFRNADGEVVGTLSIVTDVTVRKQAETALRESEEYFRSLTENALDLIHVVNADRSTRYISPSSLPLLGYRPDELIGTDSGDLIHPDDLVMIEDRMRESRHSARPTTMELRVRHRDGSWRIFEAVARNLLDDPVVSAVVVNSRDITERKLAAEQNMRLAALSRENPNPIIECDESGECVHVNPAADAVSRELGLRSIAGLLPDNHHHLVGIALENEQVFRSVEVNVRDRIFSWSYHPNPEAGVVHLFATDITTRRQMEEQLRFDALHDGLTGLPNRLLFMERLAHSILRAKRRQNHLFAVLFLDLDRFKVINDSLGHHVGDELLVVVARRLQSCLRTEDTVARLGGDEFAILLENISGIGDAIHIARRIQTELSTPVNLSGFDVFTSASIGIALSSIAYEKPEYLLRNADMAMYRAKAAGTARYEIFDREMHAQALLRLRMETDLRKALEHEQFRVHFQPILDLEADKVIAFEALLRWEHPERGWLEPNEFIPVAEETGLIVNIGVWVLGEICRQVREWRDVIGDDRVIPVSLNLSAKQLSQPDIVDQISSALERYDLPPDVLRLEITESVVMENPETVNSLLSQMKELGVQIYLDDFGTGYSSLSYLHRFPLDAVKIDQSFVSRITEDERSLQLVKTVLILARSLGVGAIAEGVETEEQLAELRKLGCEFAQGFFFAHPASAAEISPILAEIRSAE